ncbi:MAG: hypothetical protein EOO45_17560, partial [Flavobacterium sp.]
MFSKFIHRPVFAIVISIIIVFMGSLSITQLPTSQFPEIAPTTVNIFIAYPGSSADVLVKSTLITLENAINGVQDMRYIATDATSAGEATLRVIFEPGTDPNEAVIRVKTRVDQVMPLLPELVQREGVVITPIQPSMLMYVNLYSTGKNMDEKFLYNYANVNMLPEINRVKGVARSQILGSRTYAMRIWLNPDRMRAYNISVDEVMKALGEQSIVGRPGRLGQSSGIKAQSLEYVLTYKGRFSEPSEYEDIIVRANSNGESIRLKDIGKAELGSEFFDIYSSLDGHPSASIVLKQNYGSNASDVIKQVKEKLEEMKETFPPGMDYKISYDVSQFLDASIEQVLHTLRDAFILVAIVVFIFLGDWRSTLIPILAVPVSLIGAFFAIQFFGLSINLVTLFALVLAIGIVVDDAIVVVEAVHAKFEEFPNITPYMAVKKVLGEISGAIIAITAVMVSVFLPISFMSGPVGTFYRQFSITMASSIVISAIVALTLTPVLCAMLLKNHHGHERKKNLLTKGLDKFNSGFEKMTGKYVGLLRHMVSRKWLTFAILLLFCAGTFYVNKILPSGFIPSEDQGTIYAIIQTPPGSTLETTNQVSQRLQKICEHVDGVESVSSLAGYEIMTEGRGSNAGTCLINLKPWGDRKHKVTEIMEELEEKSHNLGAKVEFFEPPAIPGFGSSGGFSLRLLDKNNTTDYQDFYKQLYPYNEPPLFWIHLNVDYPFNLTGILYFPKIKQSYEIQKDKIQLYSNQVFVTEEVKDIVPEFLMLLQGVIDSPDIPLNVSRSYLQGDPNVKKINNHITKKVADKLESIFNTDRKEFEDKWDSLGLFVKYGMMTDDKFLEKANKFHIFGDVDKEKFYTLDEYRTETQALQTNKEGQLVILYTTDAVQQDSYIQAAKQKGYKVVILETIVDASFI